MINLNTTLIIQLANFLLLMFLLNRILFRPTMKVLEERKARIEGRQRKASELNATAEALWADYQKGLKEAKAEADRLRSEFVQQAEAERQKAMEAAGAQADKTMAEIRARVRSEAEQARKALRADAERLAATAAETILGRSL